MKYLGFLKLKLAALFLTFIFCVTIVSAQFPVFKDGERVCFIGNSITMNGRYLNYIELYYTTRFPNRKVEFFNCGISGDDSGGMLERMKNDILIHRPTVAVLMVGMNDVRRSLYSKERSSEPGIQEKRQNALNTYFKNVDSIIQILLNENCKVILQTPSIYDQTATLKTPANVGVNDALGACAIFIKERAERYKLPVVDYWVVMKKINEGVQEKNPAATIIGPDRVHPDTLGHFVMAYEFLKTQQAPSFVTEISINARKQKAKKEVQCALAGIESGKTGVSFTCLENSLPYPLLSKTFQPDSLVPFSNELNREILKILSLKKGMYRVKIDDVVIGNFSEKELKDGINLAKNTTTPQYHQSEKVLNLLYEYWSFVRKQRQVKYVEYQLMDEQMRKTPLTKENGRELIDKRMEVFKNQEKDYVAFYLKNFNEYLVNKPMESSLIMEAAKKLEEIRKSNKPVKHLYKISRVNENES